MARPILEQGTKFQLLAWSNFPVAIGLFIFSISILVALCAKHNRRKMHQDNGQNGHRESSISRQVAPNKSPLASPMSRIVTSLSNKAIIPLIKNNKREDEVNNRVLNEEEGGFGEGGLWQKSILMGERCRPQEFSGAIYYDSYGNQLSEMPRSPRAALLPSLISGGKRCSLN